MELSEITAMSFRPHLDSAFTVGEAGGVRLELVELELLAGGDERSFSLLFRESGEHSLGQGTHVLSHPELGELALFLAPIIPDSDGRGRYESIFNRAGS